MDEYLGQVLASVRRRVRGNRLLAGFGWGVTIGGAVALGYALAARLLVLPHLDRAVLPAVAVMTVAVALGWSAGRLQPLALARLADGWLHTGEMFATALDGGVPGPLHDLQRRQAVAAAAAVSGTPGRTVVPARRLAGGSAMLGVAGLLLVLPNPMDAERARAVVERAAAEEAAAALEAAAAALDEGSLQPVDPVVERLGDLAEELRTATLDQALEELDLAAQDLADAAQAEVASAVALDGLAAELAGDPLPGVDGGDPAAQLAAAAAAAGSGQTGDPEALAARLDQLAEALAAGLPEVGGPLGAAAQALTGSGGPQAATSALQRAADAAGEAADRVAAATRSGAASDAVAAAADRARQQVATTEGAGQGQGQGQGAGQGQGQGAGQGQGQGQGGGGGSGAPGSTVDATGTNPQGTGQGGSGTGADGSGAPPRPGAESAEAGEQIYAPVDPADELQLGGTPDGLEDSPVVGTGSGPGTVGDGRVPYTDVLGDYARRAAQTVERPGYPVRLRDAVRTYFDTLATGADR